MTEKTEEKQRQESPLERKLALGVIYCSIAIASAGFGFLYGIHHGKWSSEPISVMETDSNNDKYPDLSIIDRGLNQTRYVGTAGGKYHRVQR